jgi:streptomycin 3"-adenylyltransferase
VTSLIPVDIAAQLSRTRAVLERHLGNMLHAVHLFGSALDGGLKPHSDIDLLVTVTTAPDPSVRRALMLDLLSVSGEISNNEARPLEVTVIVLNEAMPWRYPARRELQFGEWLREDLLAGIFESPTLDHDLAILLTKTRQHSVALIGPPAAQLFMPVPAAHFISALMDTIAQWNTEQDWEGDERNVVLALARIWYSAATGLIAPKDRAAAWVLERLPEQYRAVLSTALASYLGIEQDDLAARPQETADFVRYARSVIERILGQ